MGGGMFALLSHHKKRCCCAFVASEVVLVMCRPRNVSIQTVSTEDSLMCYGRWPLQCQFVLSTFRDKLSFAKQSTRWSILGDDSSLSLMKPTAAVIPELDDAVCTMFHIIFNYWILYKPVIFLRQCTVQTWHWCQTHTDPYNAKPSGIKEWTFDRTEDHNFSVSIPSTCLFFLLFYQGKGGGSESSAVMGMLECLLSVGKHSMSLVTKVCHWPDSPWLVLFTVSLVLQHPTVSWFALCWHVFTECADKAEDNSVMTDAKKPV